MRPLVLVANDDGYGSPGIRALHAALSTWADAIIVAPETEQSATSHSLSLHRPLRVRDVEANVFAIDGTPADCVYVALHAETRCLPRWPDLVCSGINRGLNLAQDAFYSGTIAAAREGALRGIPSIAVSAPHDADLARVADLTLSLAKALFDEAGGARGPGARPGLSMVRSSPLLNVNVPLDWNGQVKKARLGARIYDETINFRTDPRGREYLWLGGSGVTHAPDPGADTEAYDQGFASITPLVLDLSAADPKGVTDRVLAALPQGVVEPIV